jgi:hypothetical protein
MRAISRPKKDIYIVEFDAQVNGPTCVLLRKVDVEESLERVLAQKQRIIEQYEAQEAELAAIGSLLKKCKLKVETMSSDDVRQARLHSSVPGLPIYSRVAVSDAVTMPPKEDPKKPEKE